MEGTGQERDLKMVVDLCRILLCGLLLAASVPRYQLGAQSPVSTERAFPEKLLEGTSTFDLAVSLQGDLRGNYGPCG